MSQSKTVAARRARGVHPSPTTTILILNEDFLSLMQRKLNANAGLHHREAQDSGRSHEIPAHRESVQVLM